MLIDKAPILDTDDITKIEFLNNNNVWEEYNKGTKTEDGLNENVTERLTIRQNYQHNALYLFYFNK